MKHALPIAAGLVSGVIISVPSAIFNQAVVVLWAALVGMLSVQFLSQPEGGR